MNESFYPPSIQGAPPQLTVPNPAYRRQVVIVLLSLAVFILFYLGLVVGSGWAVVYGIMQGLNAAPDEAGHSDGNSYKKGGRGGKSTRFRPGRHNPGNDRLPLGKNRSHGFAF